MDTYSPPTLTGKSSNVATAILVLFALAVLVFPLRVYVRVTNKAWGIDDTLMAIATVSESFAAMAYGAVLRWYLN